MPLTRLRSYKVQYDRSTKPNLLSKFTHFCAACSKLPSSFVKQILVEVGHLELDTTYYKASQPGQVYLNGSVSQTSHFGVRGGIGSARVQPN
jgi:hypothetical protein